MFNAPILLKTKEILLYIMASFFVLKLIPQCGMSNIEEIIYSRGQAQTFRDISAWARSPRQKAYALYAVDMSNFHKAMTFFAST